MMLDRYRLSTMILLSLSSIACTTTADKKDMNDPGTSDLIVCQEPRPAICTMEYDPVCGTLKDGSKKTGSTGCTSCSDPAVIGYTMGEC